MMLIGLISRSVDFAPQGLSENVFCPFVVHSQTWPPDGTGGAKGSTGAGAAAGAGTAAAMSAVTGADGVGGGATAATGIGEGGRVAWIGAWAAPGANLYEPTVTAAATQASNNPEKIHGKRSFCLPMARLCARRLDRAANVTDYCRKRPASEPGPQLTPAPPFTTARKAQIVRFASWRPPLPAAVQ